MKKSHTSYLLVSLIIVGVFLRFYNLNWGAPFYFHPDERNIASAVSGLEYPAQLNPHFFAYGSLPIYTIYITGIISNFLLHFSFPLLLGPDEGGSLLDRGGEGQGEVGSIFNVSFEQAILISRFFSALFSLALIPLLFFIGKSIYVIARRNDEAISINKDRHSASWRIAMTDSERCGLISAFFAAFSTGFIQYAHFGTFEIWLTFFSVVLFWLCLKLLKTKRVIIIFFLGIVFGILAATKISHLVLLPLLIIVLLFKNTHSLFEKPHLPRHSERSSALQNGVEESHITKLLGGVRSLHSLRSVGMTYLQTILLLSFACIVYLLTNPFVLLDYPSFIGSMHYESRVALGSLPVFYTGEFGKSVPIVFQFLHIYPFLLNPLITIIFIPAFFYLSFISIKSKNPSYIILNTFYLILFISQAFLYAKWTRYMIPTLPFIYLICSISIMDFLNYLSKRHVIARRNDLPAGRQGEAIPFTTGLPRSPDLIGIAHNDKKHENSIFKTYSKYAALSIILSISFIFPISYFLTAFVREDTRAAAKNFAEQHIPSNSPILSEVYDLGITPFNDSFHNIKLFNFYDLDPIELLPHAGGFQPHAHEGRVYGAGNKLPPELISLLENSDYIILPSQRILKPRLQEPKSYPFGHTFYSQLLTGLNGFQKIYETPCDLFCSITYLGSPVFSFEETVNVFDRPTVLIFKKISNF